MYSLIEDVIGWVSSSQSTYNSTILSCACALVCIFFALTIDLLYKLFLRFLPNNLR